MATRREERGAYSHAVAQAALLANGWQVAEPLVPEAYDLIVRAPGEKHWVHAQVKTAYFRKDRQSYVISGTRSNGEPYNPDEVELMIGVTPDADIYLFDCMGYKQYWATPSRLLKWEKLSMDFDETTGQA